MKDYILFNLFSILEGIGMFCLMLVMFRFKLREYVVHIVFASFLLSQTSYYMRTELELGNFVPLIYLLFTFLFIWLMFRVQKYYAIFMTVIGYITFYLLQNIIVFIGLGLGLYSLEDLFIPWVGYIFQTLSVAISFIICWLLIRKRMGFTFVPFSETIRVKLKGENILFLVIALLAVVVGALQYYSLLQGISSLILVVILLAIFFSGLIYLAIRREKQDG